jgi:hypothetical protein
MTPEHEEADRLLRLARQDQVTFRYDDDAFALATTDEVRDWVAAVLAWAGTQLEERAKGE